MKKTNHENNENNSPLIILLTVAELGRNGRAFRNNIDDKQTTRGSKLTPKIGFNPSHTTSSKSLEHISMQNRTGRLIRPLLK